MRHKAAKGELKVVLPAGLEYDPAGQPVLCADQAAREAIATVFRRFTELGSARQVLLSMGDDGLELPRWRAGGRIDVVAGQLRRGHRHLDQPVLRRGVRVRPHP